MSKSTPGGATFITFAIPDDPKVQAAFGLVSMRHTQLDHILRMLLKSLSGVSVEQALAATSWTGSAELRERARKLARRRLGECAALIRLQALLKACEIATRKRNELIHNVIVREVDGADDVLMRDGDGKLKPPPTVEELNALADELVRLTLEINDARLNGWLKEAMRP
jgi:hypothetical protein